MAQASKTKRRISAPTIALVLAALVALFAIIYSARRSAEPAETAADQPAPAPPPDPAQPVAAMRERLAQDPDDHEAWYRLGIIFREAGNHSEAEAAFRRATQLQPNNSDYLSRRAEALLQQETDESRAEAQRLFRRAVELDSGNAMARFYLATLRDDGGDPRGAMDELIALLRSAPANAAWYDHVRGQVESLAKLRNIDVEGRLPPPRATSAASAAIPGPTREQMEAARNIPPSQHDEMVKGMVDRLAARLQQNPRDENGWMVLMRSRMVQNDREGAAAALGSGVAAFGDDPAVQQRLRAAADELGIAQ